MAAAAPGTESVAIRFVLNGELETVEGLSPQTTLLEFLRERRRLTGSKEGCAEGDCGACAVVLAEVDPDGPGLRWRPVNACIRMLPSVDGKAVYTVEALKAADGTLHPVQRALVDCHGSQCGFCTPGFAMSLFGLYKNARAPSRAAIEDALSGNLCRCTGYRSIVDAAQAMYDSAQGGNRGRMARLRRRCRWPPRDLGRRSAHCIAARYARAPCHVRVRSRRPAMVGTAFARRARRIAGSASESADHCRRDRRRPVGHQAPSPPGRRQSTSATWPSCRHSPRRRVRSRSARPWR